MIEVLKDVADFVWGAPLLTLLVGTGVFLSIVLKGLQFKRLGHSLYLAFVKRKEKEEAGGDITHFQALMTALAATVGTGNIAGVATAIAAGGPGALFWMWITGLFGMATKYSEAVLAVRYRTTDEYGTMCGGPMYYLSRGLGKRWLGVCFALFASVAAFGIGNMVQSNSVADAVSVNFGVPKLITGLVLSALTALVVIGGIKGIAKVTQILVPFMVVLYMMGAFVILVMNYDTIPGMFLLIIRHAFSPTSAIGGFAGCAVMQTIRYGVARGVFSNESGLGSSPIAAAAAKTKHPVTQALVSMTQTFIDTIVVCSMTGFVIISTGLWSCGKTGAALTSSAFAHSLPFGIGGMIVAIGLILFAYSTLLGWCYYGEKSIQYLFGIKSVKPYRIVFVVIVAIGAIVHLEFVWTVSDIMNGLMAFPNLVGLIGLYKIVVDETGYYFRGHFNR